MTNTVNSIKVVKALIGRSPLTWAFHVLMLAVGVAIVLGVVLFGRAIDDRLTRDLAGVDLVVGAKGSPTQLILSTLFATDVPTGNIPLVEAERIMRSPLVRQAVTVSLGDSVQGYRIVGTQPALLTFYEAAFDQGQVWQEPLDVVLGAEVARRLNMMIGARFAGQHGLAEGGETHDASPYTVVGILKPTGAALDRMVLTSAESVWEVHEHEHENSEAYDDEKHESGKQHHDQDASSKSDADREVTAVLIRYKSAMGALMLPRQISAIPDLQAAIPAMEAARLTSLTGAGTSALQGLGSGLLALSTIGFCVALAVAVNQRRAELSLMRVMGISPQRLASIVLVEASILGLLSGLIGIALGRAMIALGASAIAQGGGVLLQVPAFGRLDLAALMCAVVLALGAAIIPCLMAYRTNPVAALKGEAG